MTKKKACKRCKVFVEGTECPACKSNQFVLNWKGRVFILDPSRSDIAKKIGVTATGEYAIKVT
ncbi:DNA-directed RNA polymerase subunit E'' [Candidatus Woesearchaeota archaeon]|nr:DNA-directed RNA polymerase subunit E'' [Candidatus Woesearchaeota archaeon]